MAYLPPGGGRMNVTIGSNTAGVGSLISTGTMALAGGSNITLSQNGANGITFHGANQSAQTVGFYATGANTIGQSSSSTLDARSVNISGQGGLSVGLSGNTLQMSVLNSSSLSATGIISLSPNGNTLSIGAPAFSAGISNIGNTNGTSGTASNQVIFAGGNNITLSQSTAAGGNTVTISAANQSAQTQSNIQAIYDGANSISTGTIRFSNSNGIGFGINGQTLTASHNGITSQTAQTVGIYATGANTTGQSSSNTLDARSFSISGQGDIYVGMSGNTMQISGATTYAASNHSHGNPTLNLTNLSGTTASASNGLTLSLSAAAPGAGAAISAAGASASNGTVVFSNSNGLAFGMNGSTVTGSYTVPTVTNSSFTVQAGASTLSSVSRMAFGDGNGISFGASTSNNGSITITGTVATNYAASNHSHGNPTLNLTNLSGTTASASNGFTLSLSAAAPGAGGGIAMYDGANSISSGTARLSAGGALTASINGQTLSLNAPATSSLSASGAVSIVTNASTISIGAPAQTQLTYAGIVSLSSNGSTLTISAPAYSAGMSTIGNTTGTTGMATNQLVFAGTNGVTLSQNTGAGGNTITISGQAATLSRWENNGTVFTSLNTVPQGSLSIQHMYVPFNITGTAMKIGGMLSVPNSVTSATTMSVNYSLWMGIYTLTGSTLSLATSGSANNGFQWAYSANSSSNNTYINGMRQMTVTAANINMTPGEYWIAAALSSATTYTSGPAFTIYGNNLIGVSNSAGYSAPALIPINSSVTAARDALLFQGIYTAVTSAGPATIVGAGINNTQSGYVMRAAFYNAIYNATY